MKKIVLAAAAASLALSTTAAEPVWQFGKQPFSGVKGNVKLEQNTVAFDGTNSFTIPISVLGKQQDYTIEFEIKRDSNTPREDRIVWMNFADPADKSGMAIKYCPPDYNAILLTLNDGEIEQRGFLPDARKFYKYTFVVKDQKLQIFRDGLLVLLADTVKPSKQPITFGEITKNPVKPYLLRDLKIYNEAIFPSGFDRNASHMRTCTGDQYTMLKADIKNPALPRILVVGDSISMGYRNFITEHFKGRANVDYWVGGTWFGKNAVAGDNAAPKRGWRGVFSHGPYDVVSWNSMTLHMWNLRMADRCPEESLEPNMMEMTGFLQQLAPKTKFIWVRCTPWRNNLPDGTPVLKNPENDRIIKYNKIVDGVMKKRGIPEVDLYAVAESRMGTVKKGWADTVHWDAETSKIFADAIIKEIEKALPKSK